MQIDKQILKNLSQQFGDSFYLLDTAQFKKNYLELQSEFQNIYPKSKIAYSYKTNYIPRLCQIVEQLGGYAEVVSDMECEIARRIGVQPEHIAFNGPYKNKVKLEEFLLQNININVDSIAEMENIKRIAEKHPSKKIGIGIRCNFDIGDGILSRFGLDIEGEDFKKVLDIIRQTKNLYLKGIHSHFATRNLDTWSTRTCKMLQITKSYCDKLPEYICLGGGIFGKMAESLKAQFESYIPTYKEYAEAVGPQFMEAFYHLPLEEQPCLFIEPGSALVGDCMRFAAKVESIKTIRGKNIATVLGSIYNINPTLNKKNPPIKIYHMGKEPVRKFRNLDFGGFTCIESDYLYRNFSGDLAVGDYVVFENVGSYSIVLKPPFILPNFAVIELISDKKIRLVKRAEQFEDLFHTFDFSKEHLTSDLL